MSYRTVLFLALLVLVGALVLRARAPLVARARALNGSRNAVTYVASSSTLDDVPTKSPGPSRTADGPHREFAVRPPTPDPVPEREPEPVPDDDEVSAHVDGPSSTLPGESRAEVLQNLAASGPDHSTWTRSAAAVVTDLKRELSRELGRKLEFGKVACFTKGCAWDVVYESADAYESSAEGFWQNARLSSWSGVRARTQVETLDSGKVVVSWLLLNPELAREQSGD